MSVGGYGGFLDAMMHGCWLAVGLIEEELGGAGREGTIL